MDKLRAEALRDFVKKKSIETKAKTFFLVVYGDQLTWISNDMGQGETLDRLSDAFVNIRRNMRIDPEENGKAK